MNTPAPVHYQPSGSPWTACGFRRPRVQHASAAPRLVTCKRCRASAGFRLRTNGSTDQPTRG